MKLHLIIFLISASMIAGCSAPASNDKPADIFAGTDGLVAEFEKNTPPQRVFEQSSFPVLLKLANKGTYSITKDKPALISISREKDYIPALSFEESSQLNQGKENEVYFGIEGKTQVNPKGNQILIALNAKTGKLEPQSEAKASTITANLCYPYKTILSTSVCIDPDIAGIIPGKKACTAKELTFSNGQGAPISVTKIEPQIIPEIDKDVVKPQFLIFIENKGKGNPANINSYPNICRSTDSADVQGKADAKNIWNVAFLKAFTSGEEDKSQLICCPNIEGQCPETESSPDKILGYLKFRDKKDFVKCTFKEGVPKNSDAFTSPLRIEIDYGYVQSITADFIIQKPLKY